MDYEELLMEAGTENIDVDEHYHFKKGKLKGLYVEGNIALSDTLRSNSERCCILAEEIGHHYKTYGDIMDPEDPKNKKQEHIARVWAYERLVSLTGIISAYNSGCKNLFEIAEHLNVTEKFAHEAIDHYRKKYGVYVRYDDKYVIYFEPNLGIFRLI